MKDFLISIFIGLQALLGIGSEPVDPNFGATILFPHQGGTGIGSATAGDVGKVLAVSDDSPFTYTLQTVSGTGDITNGSSLGTGLNIFDSKSGSTLRFNSISAGSNISISTTSNSNTLVISSTGGGGSSAYEIATTSGIAVPQVAYFTQTGGRTTLGSVATGTITCSGTGISCNTTGLSVLGGNLTITGSDTNASSTLLADTNSWSARQDFNGNASTTGLTVTGSTYLATAGGNVGVGTANPNSLLQIYGQGADILTIGNGVDTSTSFNVQNRALFGYNQTRAAATVQGISGRGIDFNVNNSTFGSGQAMVITSAGSVGIGSTTPWGLLSVNANGLSSGAPQFVVGSSTATNFIVANGGNVGIGTSNPGQKLDVNGNIAIQQISNDPTLQITAITSGTARLNMTGAGGGAAVINGVSTDLYFQTNSSSRMIVKATTGNVGVGTTSPLAKLSVESTAGAAQFVIGSSTATQFIVDKNGNVGVGTVSPIKALDVRGDAVVYSSNTSYAEGFNIFSSASSATGAGLNIHAGSAGTAPSASTLKAAFRIRNSANNYNFFFNNESSGASRVIFEVDNPTNNLWLVPTTGNVGVGSTTPGYLLTIASSTAPQLSLSAGAGIAQWTMRNAGGNLYFATTTVAGTATSTVSALSINSNGQITIPGLVSCDSIDTNASGVLSCGTDATGGGGSNDFTWETTLGQLTAATSSRVWFKSPIYASSTLQFNTNLISEHASLRFFDIQGRAGGDYTLARIKAPLTTPYEATLALLLDESGDNSGINESFLDLYNEGYADSYQAGFRLINNGTARMKPIVLGHYNDDGLSKDNGNKLVLFPSGTVWMGQGTSTANLSTQLHISSSTATNLLRIDGSSSNRLVVAQTGTTINGGLDLSGATVKQSTYSSFSYATTTWTGTTTIPLGPAYTAESWSGVKCFTDTGTVNVSFYDGTNRMNMFNASTTVGSVSLSSNNTFTASEKRYVDIGTVSGGTTKISCTVDKIVNN